MELYISTVKNDKRVLYVVINELKSDYYLYRAKNSWIISIDKKLYNKLLEQIEVKNTLYNNMKKKDRSILRHIRKLKRVISNLKLTNVKMDEFELVKRSYKIDYTINKDITSDISSSGFKHISTSLNKLSGISIKLSITINEYKYSRHIDVGRKYTLKYALYELIKIKCNILDISIPSIESLDFTKAYRYADLIGYMGDPYQGEFDMVPIDTYSKRLRDNRKDNKMNNLRKITSSTGYNSINLHANNNIVYLTVRFKHDDKKRYLNIRIDHHVDYKELLDKALKFKCDILNIDVPDDIDYQTGEEYLKMLFLEINKVVKT